MVAPTGSTKRMMRLSMWLFSRRHLKVIGRVAELQHRRRWWWWRGDAGARKQNEIFNNRKTQISCHDFVLIKRFYDWRLIPAIGIR